MMCCVDDGTKYDFWNIYLNVELKIGRHTNKYVTL
jgi:hypothetical protein